eukprot:6549015-Alexandrium_andersonii.AAC.1
MSASLVGSEMCIRDRGAPRSRPALACLTSQVARPRLRRRDPKWPLQDRTCLLYTSDAADDM